jgi:DNA-binding transcriptional LysR family regulator
VELKVRQLEVFQAVYETGSVTGAAARLHCSQPAVSASLANFERQLGLRLFDRARGRFTATPEADLLYAEVERGLMGINRIATRAAGIRAGRTRHMRIGIDGSPAIGFVPAAVASFLADHPDVTIDIESRPSTEIVDLVANRLLDAGVVEPAIDRAGVRAEPFAPACVCLVPADHQLASEEVLTPQLLSGVPMIGCFERHPIDLQLGEVFEEADCELNIVARGFYHNTSRNLARCGIGIAVVDSMNGSIGVDDGLVTRPFIPEITYEMGIVSVDTPNFDPIVDELISYLWTAVASQGIEVPAGRVR